jgi:hypothetical protein
MRRTRGNGWETTGRDAAMNETRNDLVEDCWSHGKGAEGSGSGVSGVGRRSQSSRVNWNRGNESGMEKEWLTCIN